MAYLIFVLISLIWGSSFILMKIASQTFGPTTLAGLRVAGGAAVLAAFLYLTRKQWQLSGKRWLELLPVIVLGNACPFIVQAYLIGKHQESAFFGMVVSLVPLLTIVVSVPMLMKLPTARQVVGVLGGLAFVYVLMRDKLDQQLPLASVLLAITVPLGYAISNTWIKRRLGALPAVQIMFGALGGAAVICLPVGVASEPLRDLGALPAAGGAIAVLAILGSGLAPTMFVRLIHDRGPLFASLVTYMIPCVALIWGWVDGDPLTLMQVGALSGILAMVAIVQWPRRKSPGPLPLDDGAGGPDEPGPVA